VLLAVAVTGIIRSLQTGPGDRYDDELTGAEIVEPIKPRKGRTSVNFMVVCEEDKQRGYSIREWSLEDEMRR
jgi:hypothetical protein